MSGNDRKERNIGGTEAFLVALVAGHSIQASARAAGISEATAHRRLKDPEVKARLDELRHATLATASDRLATLAVGAVTVLGQIANDPDVGAATRVRACDVLLSRALHVRDAAMDDQRLAELERRSRLAALEREQWGGAA